MMRIIAVLLIFGGLQPQPATATFNLSSDFSFQQNSKGVWQYGYSATNSRSPGQFQFDKFADAGGAIGFWHPGVSSRPGPGWYPYIAFNKTNRTQRGSQNGWAVRAGEVAMEASNTGQYSLLRFIAPQSGEYKISARFEGVHFGLSSTDVHVLHNSDSLFDAEISGYGGDPAFHKIEGEHPAATYSGSVKLKVHDTIIFAVGYGRNKTNYCDTTGLVVSIALAG